MRQLNIMAEKLLAAGMNPEAVFTQLCPDIEWKAVPVTSRPTGLIVTNDLGQVEIIFLNKPNHDLLESGSSFIEGTNNHSPSIFLTL